MGQSQPLFVYFHSFHIPIQVANIDSTWTIEIEKSEDFVLGIRTQGRRMVNGDDSAELWWPPEVIS